MKYFSYINTAASILESYKGEQPFSIFLKDFFRQYKKYGSRDRKQISQLCYASFRTGYMLKHLSTQERLLAGLFLCSFQANEMLQHLKPEWNEKTGLTVKEKCSLSGIDGDLSLVFPWKEDLSEGMDHEKFCESSFMQPDFFLRIRPGYEQQVIDKLQNAGIIFEKVNPSCLALSNGSKAETIIAIDKEVVVQDYNSQQIGSFLRTATEAVTDIPLKVWDCCAASGGKSLMLYDIDPRINLTVSDIRKNILVNLENRFAQAGILKYRSFVADLLNDNFRKSVVKENFDIIMTDVPCTGSGTWGRTPEQLYYFNPDQIEKYSTLQKKIVTNIIPYLQKSGMLVYITCSVFRKENEEAVEFMQQQLDLKLVNMKLLKGYNMKADTMFVAILKK